VAQLTPPLEHGELRSAIRPPSRTELLDQRNTHARAFDELFKLHRRESDDLREASTVLDDELLNSLALAHGGGA
jgi:hypothetical protein